MSMPAMSAMNDHLLMTRRFAYLLLLTSERAWAHAMQMRSIHSADTGANGLTGTAKRHIVSRLQKASVFAKQLVELLQDTETSKASSEAILEVRAYYLSLCGAIAFEKQRWQACVQDFAEARFIYTTLAQSQNGDDLFRDLSSSTIDPSIRYAAYQLKIPRTTSIESIVLQSIRRSEAPYVAEILNRYPEALDDQTASKKTLSGGDATDVPTSLQWMSRNVKLEDAATAQALAAVSSAERTLSSFLSANPAATARAKAAAYDEVLIPSQDAVDATKTAIDELTADGVPQSDPRMQSLQITRTAVNYGLIGWRTGRNRILCGEQDGAVLEPLKPRQDKKAKQGDKDIRLQPAPVESTSHRLKRLKERVVLYDATLQSLESVHLLPGVAADQLFLREIESKSAYFAALRCLAIARSYSLLDDIKHALGLLARALEHCSKISQSTVISGARDTDGPPNLTITATQTTNLQTLLQSLLLQYRAMVELRDLPSTFSNFDKSRACPFVERLDEYPPSNIDLTNLVTFPPKIEPIPVKPLFLDAAYNYIEYPGRTKVPIKQAAVNGSNEPKSQKEVKKGWFGFGR